MGKMGTMRSTTFLLACLAGCADPGVVRVRLDSGATAEVDERGTLRVQALGRDLFATAEGHAVRAHRFDLAFQQAVGFYEFIRENETTHAFSRVVRRARVGRTLEVDFALAQGAADADARLHVVVSDGPAEVPDSTRIRFEVSGFADHASTSVPLRCDEDATFLGFGEQYNAIDQRGEAFALFSTEQGIGRGGNLWLVEGDAHTTYLPMPYYLDARGFGTVVRTSARVLVDLCASEPEVAWIDVEEAQPVDVLVLHGPTPGDVVRQVGDLYGRPDPIPDWALGPWIGIQGGQQAVVDEAAALATAGVPYTALWAQDWVGRRNFTTDQVGVKYHWTVDTTLYPDLPGLIDALHADGKRFLGYANPWVVMPLEHYGPMDAAGMLIRNADGTTYEMAAASLEDGSLPDLTDPAAVAYVRGYLAAMVEDFGMDGWMCDFGEALPVDSFVDGGGTGFLEHNLYPGRWHSLSREVLEDARTDPVTGEEDFALFSRSGWLGTQGSAQIVWVGDQEADFSETDGLPTVIPAMLNLGLSGVPFTTHDIAGFSGGPSDAELYARWTELGAFTLVMRTHEGLRRAQNWNWNGGPAASPTEIDATIAHFRRFSRIHQALVPYFAELVDEAATTSMPPLRHLLLVFPDDADVIRIDDEFFVGDALLVAPVVEAGATSRSVYFPAGTYQHALRPTETYEGPGTFVVPAPIGEPPVFWRGTPRVDLASID